MKLRCTLDGLLLDARIHHNTATLEVFDSGESFVMEALEAIYYEIVTATCDELLGVQRGYYRLLRCAADFQGMNN